MTYSGAQLFHDYGTFVSQSLGLLVCADSQTRTPIGSRSDSNKHAPVQTKSRIWRARATGLLDLVIQVLHRQEITFVRFEPID